MNKMEINIKELDLLESLLLSYMKNHSQNDWFFGEKEKQSYYDCFRLLKKIKRLNETVEEEENSKTKKVCKQ